jgi:hypothetical protein
MVEYIEYFVEDITQHLRCIVIYYTCSTKKLKNIYLLYMFQTIKNQLLKIQVSSKCLVEIPTHKRKIERSNKEGKTIEYWFGATLVDDS